MNCRVCFQIGTMIAADMLGFGEGFRRELVEEGRGYLYDIFLGPGVGLG